MSDEADTAGPVFDGYRCTDANEVKAFHASQCGARSVIEEPAPGQPFVFTFDQMPPTPTPRRTRPSRVHAVTRETSTSRRRSGRTPEPEGPVANSSACPLGRCTGLRASAAMRSGLSLREDSCTAHRPAAAGRRAVPGGTRPARRHLVRRRAPMHDQGKAQRGCYRKLFGVAS